MLSEILTNTPTLSFGCNRHSLRQIIIFQRWQFSKSSCVAAGRGDLVVIKWLFAHFADWRDMIPEEATEKAAKGAHLRILQVLWE
ncbi:unnamed protein product [Phytophthora lilii]|uniref:Unnamed protein product n=1 Tax=Phytophthora lilii TaxID=2077276 RepID=A0A9W6WM90_9STRA|nr:unnamed protein product [Phytophthora lilii]